MSFESGWESIHVVYGDMIFIRQCPGCGRIVKAPKRVLLNYEKPEAIGQCSRCGPIQLPFEGYYDAE